MTVVIRAAALIDGVSAEPVALAEVQIEGSGRIVYAGSRADAPVVDHPDKVYDLPGLTLLPGLIDSHVHQTDVAAGSGEANDVKVTLRALYPLRTMLHSGITSARNPGAPGITSMELREAQASGQIEGPRMLVAGRILCPTGGHGYSSGLEADGPEGVRKATRILFKQGANFIKMTRAAAG